MYIRLIDSTLRENEYLFRLNDQQKVSYGYENERISTKNKKKQKEFVSVAFFRSIIEQPITKGKF